MAANVLTQRNAPDRQGINREETILNPGNVDFSTFGRIGSYPVVGTVYAQPLFVSGVSIGGRERNVVVVVTMENMVYAFDAAQTGAAAQIWPAGRSPNGLKLGEPVPSRQFEKTSQNLNDPGGYNDFYQKPIGLLSTPVVDPAAGAPTIYLVSAQFDQARFQANGSVATADMFQHILYAIDLRTGNILRQQAITGQYPGSGYRNTPNPGTLPPQRPLHVDNATHTSSMIINFAGHAVTMTDATGLDGPQPMVHFNSAMQLQRPGLLLQGRTIIVAFGSRGDEDPYHGWVFSYDADTFSQGGVFCTTPNGIRGGIWQAGQGLVQDSKSNIYACTGNGDNDKPGTGPLLLGRNLAESFLGLRCDAPGLRLNGWFTLFRDMAQNPPPQTPADALDDDFGAGAPALLPDDRLVAGGKDGWFFVIDPDQLDKVSSKTATPQAFKASFNVGRGSRFGNTDGKTTRHIHGSPVVWDTGNGPVLVYVWGENDVVRAYQYSPEQGQDPTTGRFLGQPANFVFGQAPPQGVEFARGNIYASNEVAARNGMPGGFLALTVNGTNATTGILWATYPPLGNANQQDVEGALVAYDASAFDANLAYRRLTMLWNSRQVPGDALGDFAKFCCPMIANGRVYQATGSGQVVIYGMNPPRPQAPIRIGFNGGASGFALNGSTRLSADGTVVLTELPQPDPKNPNAPSPTFLAGSFFTKHLFDIRRFTTTFTFRLTAAGADGFTFTIQAEGPRAIGSSGRGVGYAIDPLAVGDLLAPTPAAMQSTILHSFALRFGLRDLNGVPVSHLGLWVNGDQMPGFVDVDLLQANPGPVDLRGGSPIAATLRYDGNVLAVQLRDTVTNVSTQNFQLIAGDIAQQINSVQGKAHVGFTGGTGGLSARQEITHWDFQPSV
jgi:hypothetical protein